MGYDTPKPMGAGAGSHMPARVFSEFMTIALKDVKDQPFSVPGGIEFRRINRKTGTAANTSDGGMIIQEAFKIGQKPNTQSDNNKIIHSDSHQQSAEVGGVF